MRGPPNSRSFSIRRGRIDLESEFPQPMEFVEERSTAESERLGGLGPVEIVFTQGEKNGLSFEVFQAAGLNGLPFRGLRRVLLDAGGEVSGRIKSPWDISTALSIALRSSRTLPGHLYPSRKRATPGENFAWLLVNCARKSVASGRCPPDVREAAARESPSH